MLPRFHSLQRTTLRLCLVSALFASACVGRAQEPDYFRARDGVAAEETKLPDDFQQDGQLLWRTELLPGHSSPCVAGDRVVVTTYDAEKEALATVALDVATGEVLWSRPAPIERLEPFHRAGSPAASSPATNGRQIFVFFGSYGLLCYDLDGKLLWDRKMGPFQDEFGASSSPILVDDKVILLEDHDVDSFLIAIDQKSGETIWKTDRSDQTRSYATPAIWDNGHGEREIIVAGALQLAGYDLKTGKKKWWVNQLSRIVDSTPIVTRDAILVASWTPGGDVSERISMEPFDEALRNLDQNKDGEVAEAELPEGSPVIPRFFRMDLNLDGKLNRQEWEKHAAVFAKAQNVAMSVRPGGEGDVTSTHVRWVARKGLPTVPSSVLYDNVLYMVKDSGIVTSLDAQSGEILQRGRAKGSGNYYASLVAGDGKVYLASERGVVTVLRASRSWSVLSSHDFAERIVATPVIRQGILFIRTDDALYAYRKK